MENGTSNPRTMFEKIWDTHVVHAGAGQADDPVYRSAPGARSDQPAGVRRAATCRSKGSAARADGRNAGPQRSDDGPAAADRSTPFPSSKSIRCASNCEEFGVRLYDLDNAQQGIVHVIGPELGLTQPGMTIVCGDSHTATHGAFGALAFGIGTSEVEHVLATQTLLQSKPKTFELRIDGKRPRRA